MRYLFVFIFVGLFSLSAQEKIGKIHFKIVSVPQYTKKEQKIYMASNFNNWNPGDPSQACKKYGKHYILSLTGPIGKEIFYKFTLGNWGTVEKGKNFGEVRNREAKFQKREQTIKIKIHNWSKAKGKGISTITGNVQIIKDFFIPQLLKKRTIRIYLPKNYSKNKKRYPVLYMHDGQNLFDRITSHSGEWGIDESLENIFSKKKLTAIVVGIDNGMGDRHNEYCPWIGYKNLGGKGERYCRFIVETLKPFIDKKYRTLPGRKHTAISGSSMGGLISLYAILKYPHIFSKAGMFSSAFWFAKKDVIKQIKEFPLSSYKKYPMKLYFDVGTREGSKSRAKAYIQDSVDAVELLRKRGKKQITIQFIIDKGAIHHETAWARRFPAAFVWLFQE